MKILVVGNEANQSEFEEKFGASDDFFFLDDYLGVPEIIDRVEVVFDFLMEDSPENFEFYASQDHIRLFINTVKFSLAELAALYPGFTCEIFGFNGLPGFFNRNSLEVCVLKEEDKALLNEILKSLDTPFYIVQDRVGLVTPRVICMIINEAYYTLQEGTASKEDINLGMKLGTNYPLGPFEWCDRIGINHVYEVLEALQEDTKDERYKICPALKRDYLLN